MVIVTYNLGLRFDNESYDEFIQLYDRHAKTCRVIYNWTAHECTEDDCLAYVQVNSMPYMDGTKHKVAGRTTNQWLGGPGCARRHVLCNCSGGARK